MPRQIKAGLFLGFFGLLVGYVLVVEFVNAQLFSNYDFLTLAFDWERIMRLNWDVFLQALAIMFACFGVAAAFGAHSATQALTRVGKTNWQTGWALRWNGLLGTPGDGFVVPGGSRDTADALDGTADGEITLAAVVPDGAPAPAAASSYCFR